MARRAPLDATLRTVLVRFAREITHMRQQLDDGRFGLVFGAGASSDFGFPCWEELIQRIAKHPDVDAPNLLDPRAVNSSRSQLLFNSYRSKVLGRPENKGQSASRKEMIVKAGWQKIVHEVLYRDVPENIDDLQNRDQYLHELLPTIKRSRITINYNFDDTLERFLAAARSEDERTTRRGFTTEWRPFIQPTPQGTVVYHPNGFLPRRLDMQPSDDLVFLEDAFADQLIDSMAGQYASLTSHLSQNTCLLVGLSLSDATLKHLLRQNARLNPGHVHYYLAHVEEGRERNEWQESAVVEANFEVYNLITLFLDALETAAIGRLLSMEEEAFVELCAEVGVASSYRYFLVGPVSVGKSTTLSHFRCLRTYDEWLEERPLGMERDPAKLDNTAVLNAIDSWVAHQWGLKNKVLLRARLGITLVDRGPLDAFAFGPRDGWRDKAELTLAEIRGKMAGRRLCSGHVILMTGEFETIANRAIARHRDTSATRLREEATILGEVYRIGQPGTSSVDIQDLGKCQVAKQVARIVYRTPYTEAPLDEWLVALAQGAGGRP
ncbi:MAG: SIR2 family protein [Thermoanaerobaculaceae bacterium]